MICVKSPPSTSVTEGSPRGVEINLNYQDQDQHVISFMTCRAKSYHIKVFHVISCPVKVYNVIMSLHVMSYHFKVYIFISCQVISFQGL